uniref:Uncharacterized protein n=1 Tax=Glossina pallidipes TaxID=7398 RepID=A0A1A9ZUZ4_GLOPL
MSSKKKIGRAIGIRAFKFSNLEFHLELSKMREVLLINLNTNANAAEYIHIVIATPSLLSSSSSSSSSLSSSSSPLPSSSHDRYLRKGVDCDRLPQPFAATFVYLDKPVVVALLAIVVVVAAAENPPYSVPLTYCYHAEWYGPHNGRSTPPASKSERENSAFFLITSLMVANTAVIVSSDYRNNQGFLLEIQKKLWLDEHLRKNTILNVPLLEDKARVGTAFGCLS